MSGPAARGVPGREGGGYFGTVVHAGHSPAGRSVGSWGHEDESHPLALAEDCGVPCDERSRVGPCPLA
jgi:hypothetical protein